MKKIVLSLIIAAVLIVSGAYYFSGKKSKTAVISGHKFILETVMSQGERERGLSGRESLCRECGMLFVFPQKGEYSFWMKDMKFDLDIIWIADGKIAYLAKNVSSQNLKTIKPDRPADYVLEISGGLCDEYGIREGDEIKFLQ
jgi:hypothetical protein